jgi:SAM-dependent methyltransferase
MSVNEAGWKGFVEEPSSSLMFRGGDAFEKLLEDYEFQSILDVGCGDGLHTLEFKKFGKTVSSIDSLSNSHFIADRTTEYLTTDYAAKFDAIWCCHVLEHNLDVAVFLKKIYQDLKMNGVLAITVPPAKHNIVDGHVSIWNAGLLLYNMIICGFDCSNAAVKTYGYNISVIVQKAPTKFSYFETSLEKLSTYFPVEVENGFDGRLKTINW